MPIDTAAVGRVLAGGMSALASMLAVIAVTGFTMARYARRRR